MQPKINKYQNLLKLRYHAIGLIAFINFVIFFSYFVREGVFQDTPGIIRLGNERIEISTIVTCIAISIAIFAFSYFFAKKYPLLTTEWSGNKLQLKLIIAATIVIFVFFLIGSPSTYLSVHLKLGQSNIANKLLGIVYFIIGNISIMAIVTGNFRRLLLLCVPFIALVMLTLGMRSIYIIIITVPVAMVIYSSRAILWAPVVLMIFLVGAILRSGNLTPESLLLQTSMLVWAPAYQIDVYASQNELANLVSQSYVADGGGVGSFISLDFEKYFPYVNGLYMTSLFPIILFLLSKAPISNAIIIAIGLFYPIAVRNNFDSYMPILILYVAGSVSVFFRWGKSVEYKPKL